MTHALDLAGKTVYVIDSHGLLFQLFYALPPMTSPQGEPVNAVYGFAKDLLTLLTRHRPDYLFCAFDHSSPTFRHASDPQYKANRAATPDDLRPQIELVREVVDAFGVASLVAPGFEADDILATLAAETESRGGRCCLVTSDKDARQLITDQTSLYMLRKQQPYTATELLSDWGITPEQVVDFQAMCGDASDNVRGISGVGPKTATQLLQQFGSLDAIFANVNTFTGKRREMFDAGRSDAEHARELVRLRRDVPLEINWDAAAATELDSEQLQKTFLRFGFRTLIASLPNAASTSMATATPAAASLWDEPAQANPPVASLPPLASPIFHTVTRETFAAFIAAIKLQKVFSFDTETVAIAPSFAATQPRYTEIVGMSFCWSDDEAWYLPLLAPLGEETLDRDTTLAALKPILEDANVGKVGQNLKFDSVVLRGAGIELRGLAFDTMVADYLLNTGLRQHNLDILAETYLNHKTIKIAELIGSGKKQRTMRDVPLDVITRYAGEDAWVVWRLVPILRERLAEHAAKLVEIFERLEMPLIEVLVKLEWNGIAVDVDALRKLSEQFAAKLENLEREAFDIAGHPFNLASPKQLATVLFDELKLPVVKKTKTGASTDVEVLEELATQHALPAKVVAHRQVSKLKGTYADALVTQIHPQTQRIHASFNQVVTATGRLSSSDPNLQNIPTRTEEGRAIRAAFRPGAGFDLLLACDYSQIELRVLAHFSEDERLCRVLASGADIHTTVAAEIFGVGADDVTSDMRRQAKAVNFGIIYGQTAFGLSKQLGIPRSNAEQFITAYLENYPGVVAWMDATLDKCAAELIVTTLDGRERRITGVRTADVRKRDWRRGDLTAPERMAINTVIQGSAADLMKRAMVAIDRRLPETNLRAAMLLQIHDELVFEVTQGDLAPLTELVVELMSLGQPLRVPLVIDTESGATWN